MPPGTFVPPHIHPDQDEYLYMLEGKLDFMLGGADAQATAGDLIRLGMGVPHGIFNKSDQTAKVLFWVSPTRKLYDLFWGLHNMKEQKPEDVVAMAAEYNIHFLPPPPGRECDLRCPMAQRNRGARAMTDRSPDYAGRSVAAPRNDDGATPSPPPAPAPRQIRPCWHSRARSPRAGA